MSILDAATNCCAACGSPDTGHLTGGLYCISNCMKQRHKLDAAERKLATAGLNVAIALDHIESLINELALRGIDIDSNDEAIAARAFFDNTLDQIDKPQEQPPSHVPEETDYRAMGREMAINRDYILVNAANRGVKCREALESLQKQCEARGFTVEYGDHGHVTLSDAIDADVAGLETLARRQKQKKAPMAGVKGGKEA